MPCTAPYPAHNLLQHIDNNFYLIFQNSSTHSKQKIKITASSPSGRKRQLQWLSNTLPCHFPSQAAPASPAHGGDYNLPIELISLKKTSAIILSLPPSPPRWPYKWISWNQASQACWMIHARVSIEQDPPHLHSHGLQVDPGAFCLPPAPV